MRFLPAVMCSMLVASAAIAEDDPPAEAAEEATDTSATDADADADASPDAGADADVNEDAETAPVPKAVAAAAVDPPAPSSFGTNAAIATGTIAGVALVVSALTGTGAFLISEDAVKLPKGAQERRAAETTAVGLALATDALLVTGALFGAGALASFLLLE